MKLHFIFLYLQKWLLREKGDESEYLIPFHFTLVFAVVVTEVRMLLHHLDVYDIKSSSISVFVYGLVILIMLLIFSKKDKVYDIEKIQFELSDVNPKLKSIFLILFDVLVLLLLGLLSHDGVMSG